MQSTFSFLFLCFFFLVSCQLPEKGVIGEGPIEQKTSALRDFHYIEYDLSGDLFVRHGDDYKILIDAQANILPIIVIEVRGDTLHISFSGAVAKVEGIKTLVQLPAFLGLALNGSGNAIIENPGFDKVLDLHLVGTGNIECAKPIKTSFLRASVSGSGNISFKGTTDRAEYVLSGSGNIEAKDLKAKDVKAELSGSGNIYLQASASLDASLTGSGNINYKGKPTLTENITGSGHVREN